MKQKIIVKSVKIQSAFRKNGNSFACTFEQHPKSEMDREKGSLFGVVEITGEPDLSREIADIIFSSLAEAYFELATGNDALKRFEYALSRINESLAEYSEGGKDFWVGNLNAVLAVVLGKELHITQSGEAGAYLLRKSFFTSISEGLANKDGHPIKTFTNIASGALEKFDKLVVYTPSLLNHISKDHLKDELFAGKKEDTPT